jgi:hypothetical protein
VDEGRVRKEVEYGIFTRPTFDVADLVYFAVLGALGVQFGVEDRRKLHAVVAATVDASVGRRRSAKAEISPVLELKLDPAKEAGGGNAARAFLSSASGTNSGWRSRRARSTRAPSSGSSRASTLLLRVRRTERPRGG